MNQIELQHWRAYGGYDNDALPWENLSLWDKLWVYTYVGIIGAGFIVGLWIILELLRGVLY